MRIYSEEYSDFVALAPLTKQPIKGWLVVEPPLWKIWKSVGMIIPNIWENAKNVPNRQPEGLFGHQVSKLIPILGDLVEVPLPQQPLDQLQVSLQLGAQLLFHALHHWQDLLGEPVASDCCVVNSTWWF